MTDFARCAQCPRPAVFGYQIPGTNHHVNFCLEHADQYEAMNSRRVAQIQEHLDRLDDEMNDMWGLPRQPRPPRIPAPRVNVHQVHIHGNNNGVVNTGTVNTIQNRLSIITADNAALAEQLRQLTEAILTSEQLNRDQKQEAADLVSEIADDAARPPDKRKPKAIMRAVGSALQAALANAANLVQLWRPIATALGYDPPQM